MSSTTEEYEVTDYLEDYDLFLTYLSSDARPWFFPAYEKDTRSFLYKVLLVVRTASARASILLIVLPIIGVIVNIVHLVTLSRKSLTNNSLNIFLSFLAISEIITMIHTAIIKTRDVIVMYGCEPPKFLRYTAITYVLKLTYRLFQRYSCWVVIWMAVIRTVQLKSATDPRFYVISTTRSAVKMSILLFLFCSTFSIALAFDYTIRNAWTWVPDNDCVGVDPNWIVQMYEVVDPEGSSGHLDAINNFTIHFMPCIFCPILIKMLVSQNTKLKKKNTTSGIYDEKQQSETRMVVTILIFLVISEVPYVVLVLVGPFYNTMNGFVSMIKEIKEILAIPFLFFGFSHLFICVAVCPGYRMTIKSIICRKKNNN